MSSLCSWNLFFFSPSSVFNTCGSIRRILLINFFWHAKSLWSRSIGNINENRTKTTENQQTEESRPRRMSKRLCRFTRTAKWVLVSDEVTPSTQRKWWMKESNNTSLSAGFLRTEAYPDTTCVWHHWQVQQYRDLCYPWAVFTLPYIIINNEDTNGCRSLI